MEGRFDEQETNNGDRVTLGTALFLFWLGFLPPPTIGHLTMPAQYWLWTLEAAAAERVSPYKIAGVMVIESRFDPRAKSETDKKGPRCMGLMQICRTVARQYRVDPWNPRGNIRAGAKVLARLLRKHGGNFKKAVREYNGTGNKAYLREVLKAARQAERGR